jgi:hypothetical protein
MIGKCTQGGRGGINIWICTQSSYLACAGAHRSAPRASACGCARFFTGGPGSGEVRHPDPLVDGRLQRCPVRELAAARRSRKPSVRELSLLLAQLPSSLD